MALLSDIIDVEPSSFEEAVGKQVWKDAMHVEYRAIMENDVRDVVPRLERKSIVTSKWIYKIKYAADGSIEKYKARFMACGFVINYEETTAPMGRYTSIMVLAAKLEWRLHQTDEETVSCMVWLKTKCTWSSHWDLRHMTDSHMCIDG